MATQVIVYLYLYNIYGHIKSEFYMCFFILLYFITEISGENLSNDNINNLYLNEYPLNSNTSKPVASNISQNSQKCRTLFDFIDLDLELKKIVLPFTKNENK